MDSFTLNVKISKRFQQLLTATVAVSGATRTEVVEAALESLFQSEDTAAGTLIASESVKNYIGKSDV